MPPTLFRILTAAALLFPFLLSASDRPNIIYFMADDLGVGDVKCYGGDLSRTETPTFDQLAAEGMLFTDAHAVAPVCIPSRVAIMTGRYPWRFPAPEKGGPWGFLGLQFGTDTFTIADLMKQAGYDTAYIGKWHLGTRMTTRDGEVQGPENVNYSQPIKVGPLDFGFDDTFFLPGSLDMYPYAYLRGHEWLGNVTAQKGWSAFNRVGPAEEEFEDYEVLDTFSRETEDWLATRKDKPEDPFFLFVSLTSPHTPISPHPDFKGTTELGLYGDFVKETDDCLRRIMEALDKHGLAENTLLIATSDHGAASYAGNNPVATPSQFKDMQKLGHYSSGRYRGFKFSIYEGGHRVPLIMRWPGVVEAGSTTDALAGLQDMMATFSEITGATPPKGTAPDSISLLPVLKDASATPRETMVMQAGGTFGVRKGPWKLALSPGSAATGKHGNTPGRDEAWKAALDSFGSSPKPEDILKAPFVQLFNLETDPTESQNLAADHPDKVEQLLQTLESTIAAAPNARPVAAKPRPPGFVWKKD